MARPPGARTVAIMSTDRSRKRPRKASSRMVELADGRKLHAHVRPGAGIPLVLLHGLLDSAEGWTELCRSTVRPCIAVDLGGFGRSDLPTRPSHAAYAEDVIAALAVLAPRKFVLVGHSLGGGVATAVAELIPDRVAALVLLAPTGFGRIRLAEAISVPGVRDVTKGLLPLVLSSRVVVGAAYRTLIANGEKPAPGVLERITDRRGALVPGAVEATKAVVRGGLSPRAFHRRRLSFKGPVVLVWGDRDRLVPISHMAGVAAAFPHVDARVWKDMGHHPQHERPVELARLIEQTCAQVDSRRDRAAA